MVNAEHEKLMGPANSSMPTSAAHPQTGNEHFSEYQETVSMLLLNPHDLSVEELAKSLHMVMNENIDLKETVAQNNLAMRHQLSLLEQWNLQVENEKENSRSVIEECRRQIRYMNTENQLLKKTLTSSQSNSQTTKFEELDATIQSLNDSLEKMQQCLKNSHEDKEILRNIKLKVEEQNTILKYKLATANSELEKIQLERREFVNMIKSLRENAGQERDIGLTSEEKYSKNHDIESILRQLTSSRNQIDNLEKQLRLSRNETEKYKTLHAESSVYHDTASLATSPTTYTKIFDDIEKRKLKDEITQLKEQIACLSSISTEKKQRSGMDQTENRNMHGEVIRLNSLLKEAQEKADRSLYTDQYYQVKIKSINEQHDEATAKIISYEELLATKNDEILRLKKDLGKTKGQLTEVHSEKDTIAVLRAQVEVYQADFGAEREGREALASDREKLRDEMKHLQARNTQLIDELEAYHRRAVTQRGSRGNSEEPKFEATNAEFSWEKISIVEKKEEKPTVEDEIDENLLYCPKCNKTFNEIGPLEQHVNRCLDED